MKEAFLLLVFFVPCLKSQLIEELQINPNITTRLPLAFYPLYNYFYIKASSKNSSTLFLRLNSDGYIFNTPQYCYSAEDPTQKYSECNYKDVENYYSEQVNSVKALNCTISVKDDNYIIVRYTGKGLYGKLLATCYYEKKKLSTLAIVLIVVGAIIVVVVIIVIIYCVCKKRKSSVGVSNSNFPIMDQNSGNNPNYSNY